MLRISRRILRSKFLPSEYGFGYSLVEIGLLNFPSTDRLIEKDYMEREGQTRYVYVA
jgi:hypothetical protein